MSILGLVLDWAEGSKLEQSGPVKRWEFLTPNVSCLGYWNIYATYCLTTSNQKLWSLKSFKIRSSERWLSDLNVNLRTLRLWTRHSGLFSLVCSVCGSFSCSYIPVYHLHWVWVDTATLLHTTRDWPAGHVCPTTWFHMFFLCCLYLLPCRSIKGRSPWRRNGLHSSGSSHAMLCWSRECTWLCLWNWFFPSGFLREPLLALSALTSRVRVTAVSNA